MKHLIYILSILVVCSCTTKEVVVTDKKLNQYIHNYSPTSEKLDISWSRKKVYAIYDSTNHPYIIAIGSHNIRLYNGIGVSSTSSEVTTQMGQPHKKKSRKVTIKGGKSTIDTIWNYGYIDIIFLNDSVQWFEIDLKKYHELNE